MLEAPLTTWALVTMSPWSSKTTPEPRPSGVLIWTTEGSTLAAIACSWDWNWSRAPLPELTSPVAAGWVVTGDRVAEGVFRLGTQAAATTGTRRTIRKRAAFPVLISARSSYPPSDEG